MDGSHGRTSIVYDPLWMPGSESGQFVVSDRQVTVAGAPKATGCGILQDVADGPTVTESRRLLCLDDGRTGRRTAAAAGPRPSRRRSRRPRTFAGRRAPALGR